jgi:tripartite-type tricarboxylate transporter receptor subunit TctC
MFFRSKILVWCLLCGVLAAMSQKSFAAEWPNGVVKIVVPFPSGGTTDMAARLIAEELTKTLGQQVMVDNRPGGNTQIGTDVVAKAKPDGQTLLLSTSPFAILAALYPKLPYDPVRDFEPVLLIAQNPMVLVANPFAPAKTVQEIVAQSKAKPRSVNIASVGTTGMSHMSSELFAAVGRIEVTNVPYKGTGQALPDLIGGHVSYFFDNPSSSLPHIKSGKLRAIATTGSKRSPALQEVPTMAESGFPGFETVNWYGLFAPAKTSPQILDRLNEEIRKILKRPEILERLAKDAVEPLGSSRVEARIFIQKDIEKWTKVVKERGIKPD